MVKSRVSRGMLLTNNLPQLQNLRDPVAYKEEFLVQYNHYLSLLRLQTVAPVAGASSSNDNKSTELFGDLINFVSQTAQCYPTETKELPSQLSALLLGTGGVMAVKGDLRETCVRNMVMLRNKDVIDSIELLQTLLPLLPFAGKELRQVIRKLILTDLKTSNAKTKNHRLNRVVQGLLFNMIEGGMGGEVVGNKGKGKGKEVGSEAIWAVMMVRELWRKGVWTDAKTVSIAALGAFHPNTKVQSAAIHFFLGSENDADREDESSDEEDAFRAQRRNVKGMEHKAQMNKRGVKRTRDLERAHKLQNKYQKAKENASGDKTNFPALELLHDPQTFGEKLYENLSKYDKQFSLEHKVLIMQLLSRVMGAHKLCVLGFYTYVIKYLTYHQLQVTLILVSLAQSVHDLTPPDVLTPVIRKIAQEFVHPGVGAEVIAAGINSIREVCRRQPWCMEEDLLGDLIEYKKSKDKGVATASGGLLQLFREVNPGMLKRRDRGKTAAMGLVDGQVAAYGRGQEGADGIEGLELLEEYWAQQRKEANGGISDDDAEVDEDDEAGWDNWDVESEADSDSSGWMSVDSEGEDLEISDSEDEDKKEKKEKREQKKRTRKAKKAGGEGAEDSDDEDESDNDDTKSVVSSATTATSEAKKISLLAQQKILTPADFALLNELRLKAAREAAEQGGGTAAKRKLAQLEAAKRSTTSEEQSRFLTEGEILGARKRAKMDYEERMEHIRKGREGREKFGSLKGKKTGTPSSSTNREKKRNKPIMMALHSNSVVQKKKASLRDKQIRLRAAIDKQKKMKH